MAATYYTILTNIGKAKIANAIALDTPVNLTRMAVGDGNGNPTTPSETQTTLVRQRYSASINQLTIDPDNASYLVAEMIIPTTVGGWSVNEVGVFDSDNNLIAVANFPATYKPELAEGSGRDLVIRIIIQVSNTSAVTLLVNPAVVLASQSWVADNYLKKTKVAGGTTNQILAKASNADEAFKWVDPTAAVNVIVDAIPEVQTLAASQTVVDLSIITTNGIAVYIEGARLIGGVDYTLTNATRVTLARSYPAGTRIHMYQNDPTGEIEEATESNRGFVTLATTAEARALTNDAHAMTPAKVRSVLGNHSGSKTISAATTLTTEDCGKLIIAIASSFAVTLPPLSTTIAGQTISFLHSGGAGNVYIKGNGSELIGTGSESVNGANIYAGGTLTLVSNGADRWLHAGGIGILGLTRDFLSSKTTSATYQTLPPDANGRRMIIQSGTLTTATSGNVTITLPTAFPLAVVGAAGASGAGDVTVSMAPTTTQLAISAYAPSGIIATTVRWILTGY